MKKLLVWDGDNTLWQGTLLDGETPVISPERVLLCKELAFRGILQSIASRNKLQDVLEVLHKYDLQDYFLAIQADLENSKSSMIQEIVDELNLARQEDVVFIDDMEFNREEVKFSLPGVLTASPEELDSIVSLYFTKESYTEEDKSRVQRYKQESFRKQASKTFTGDKLAFLRSCNLELEISYTTQESFPRVLDLVKRANSSSALTREYTEQELKELAPWITTARVRDKFGDYGLSAIAGIGSALLGRLINQHLGLTLQATWKETPYNQAMRELYHWYKFQEQDDLDQDRVITFTKQVQEEVLLPDWVKISDNH